MGNTQRRDILKKLKYIGFYNLRLNVVYRYDTLKLSEELIKHIETDYWLLITKQNGDS